MATFSLEESILTYLSVFIKCWTRWPEVVYDSKVIKNRGTPRSLHPTLKSLNTMPVWSGRCDLPLICRQNSVLTLKGRVYTERKTHSFTYYIFPLSTEQLEDALCRDRLPLRPYSSRSRFEPISSFFLQQHPQFLCLFIISIILF